VYSWSQSNTRNNGRGDSRYQNFGRYVLLWQALAVSAANKHEKLLDGAIKIVNHIIARHILKYFVNIILNSIILVPQQWNLLKGRTGN
jgi:hypothetical protein